MVKKMIFALVLFLGFFSVSEIASANTLSNGMTFSSTQSTTANLSHEPRFLRRGVQGDDVRELQETLRAIPGIYPSGFVTGYFGAQTESAVKRFQVKEGIVTSGSPRTTGYGQVGPRTLLSLSFFALQHECISDGASTSQACIEEYYEDDGKMYGTAHALALLDTHIKHDPSFAGTCHSAMHEIAHVAVREYETLGESFMHGNAECQNGYYHGVVEEFLRDEDVDKFSADDIRNFCNKTANASPSSLLELNCVHGVGHALVYMTEDDLPRALIRCGDFLDDHLRSQCATGAFMEHSFVRETDSISVEMLKDDPAFRCVQTVGLQDECWLTLSAITIANEEKGMSTAVQFCNSLTTSAYRAKCVVSVTERGPRSLNGI
ncbi:MAG: hypothetical protein A2494_02545 [Candidatus Lloydbacteria bacterium RIFOXYC12_FULL_46_25]|uniref:Peptidoglycan binding-like domain-containing protein n=1 Tax=Candidatus Lloydbacteria bacterium RIFOXYC12_FULL_46_25 TaxID=1798670 RepID=A0A1G2E0M1_9BACT|nr:MAG: hypothetical protein A2494_02545 [Candidatus Lloydbacteria bacterium RIFOXYC12_FULL_46_25]